MSAIDISYWQHNPDFAAVRGSGVSLVIMKCGGGEGGNLYQDSVYAGNREAARSQGLAVGSYFFNGPVDPTAAANFQCSIIDWHPGDVVAIDVESNGNQPRWSPGQVHEWCTQILANGIPADRVLVYMSSSALNDGWGAVVALGVGLWVAQYGPNDGNAHSIPVPAPWPAWSLWQYTSARTCPGISGLVDTNQIAPSWASLNSTLLGADMPLDADDKVFMNQVADSIIQHLQGSTQYPSVNTIEQLRKDLGYLAGPGGSPDSLSLIHAAALAVTAPTPAAPAPVVDLDVLAAKITLLIKFPVAPTVDYAALAKAVNDDAAKRMVQ